MNRKVPDREREERIIQELIESDPQLAKEAEQFDKEYELRKKLVLARKNAELTQSEIAKKTGLKQTAISRIEKDLDTSPSVSTLIKYVDALGLQIDIAPKPHLDDTVIKKYFDDWIANIDNNVKLEKFDYIKIEHNPSGKLLEDEYIALKDLFAIAFNASIEEVKKNPDLLQYN